MTLDETIYSVAVGDGMPPVLATLIVAQARHETAGYTSDIFLSCNNAFGYKYTGNPLEVGPCTGSPEGDAYAAYANVSDSTHELTEWIGRRQASGVFPDDLTTIVTPDQYATLLKNAGYYGDTETNYSNGIAYWLTQISNLPTATKIAGGTGLLFLLALGLVAYRKKIFKKGL